jgi:hypothetical protein
MEGNVTPVTSLKMNREFSSKSCMEIPLRSSTSGHANLWYACPKCHAALTAVPIFLFPLPDQRLCTVKKMCMYTCLTA